METLCQELCSKIVKHAPVAILALEVAQGQPAAKWWVVSTNEAAKRLFSRKLRRRSGWENRALGYLLPWVERTTVPQMLEQAVQEGTEQTCRMTVCESAWGGLRSVTASAVPVKSGVAALLLNVEPEKILGTAADEFAAMASHDLEGPLRVITRSAEALGELTAETCGPQGLEYLKLLKGGTTRIQEMLNALRAYASAGTINPRFQKVDCHWVVSAACLIVKSGSEEPKPAITLGTLPKVFGDEIRLIQLFQNLIANGVKFHKKDVGPRVHVGAHFTGVEWEFTVEDEGIGIEQKYLNRIFEPFCRLHSIQEFPGSGLGLAICKRIVEQHSGRIWIESEPGKGTKVHFTLPPVAEESVPLGFERDLSHRTEV